MKNIERQFKEYMEKNVLAEDNMAKTEKKVDLEPAKKSKKRKVLLTVVPATLALVAIVVGVSFAIPHGGSQNTDIAPKALVTVDVNPSIDFVIGEDDKVISVHANNDEGKMIIEGSAIVGSDFNSAVKLIIEAENDSGYLVSGNASFTSNTIKFSVSGELDADINEIQNEISNTISDVCKELKIDEKIEKVKSYTKAELQKIVAEIDSTLEQAELNAMSYEELLKEIKDYQKEVVNLASVQLETLYNEAKNNKIEFADKEFTKSAINATEGLYQELLKSYSSLVDSLKQASQSLEELRYNLLVDPNSDYQKALETLFDKKNEVHKKQVEIAGLDANKDDLLIQAQKAKLKVLESAVDSATSALNLAGNVCDSALTTAKTALDKVIVELEKLEETFPKEIKSKLESSVKEHETAINNAKDKFFEEFEKDYAKAIELAEQKLQERKANMKIEVK